MHVLRFCNQHAVDAENVAGSLFTFYSWPDCFHKAFNMSVFYVGLCLWKIFTFTNKTCRWPTIGFPNKRMLTSPSVSSTGKWKRIICLDIQVVNPEAKDWKKKNPSGIIRTDCECRSGWSSGESDYWMLIFMLSLLIR